ncbi:MAG: hypothetical protein B7C24_10495 [Bacteroidetes bacterium 4572_77]|nr:MAG: hypothetical protein B7C24_10495 [Bacteroidetes bacterium 4572_77]
MKTITKMRSRLFLVMMLSLLAISSAFADSKTLIGSISTNSNFLSGETAVLSFNLNYSSPDWEWCDDVNLIFPAGFTINSASTINGKEALITGQTIFWDAQYFSSNVNEDFEVVVSVDASIISDQEVNYVVNGDGYGADPHQFSGIAILKYANPKLVIAPSLLELGEWPIGSWQEKAFFELSNTGTGTALITASDLDDQDDVFELDQLDLPHGIGENDPATLVGISFIADDVANGIYEGTYVAAWDKALKTVVTADVTVNAYTASTGDVFENPFLVSLPVEEIGVSTEMPMRSNYVLPGSATNGRDVVYRFDLVEDKEVNFAITNASQTPKIAVYASDFGNYGGPSISNALANGNNIITAAPLFAGTYYLVVSCEEEDTPMTFDLSINGSIMPLPQIAFNPSPLDGDIDVINPLTLSWEFGAYTNEYKLSYGTTYPPSEVLVDWTNNLATSYELGNIDPSLQYFWRVDVRNNNGELVGDNWGFTTTITPPADLTTAIIEIAEDEYNVELNWTSSSKSLKNYKIYRNGENIATVDGANTSYLDEDLTYNMDPCYEYTVEALFDEGVSALSNISTACITGVGTVEGIITELLTGELITTATIKMVSATGGQSYTLTTDLNGYYTAEVLEDTYNFSVEADTYITEVLNGVDVVYNTTLTQDFQLDEFPYPTSDVIAYQSNDNTVNIVWGESNIVNYEWMVYDDDEMIYDGVSAPQIDYTLRWANKYVPEDLVGFNYLSKIAVAQVEIVEPNYLTEIRIMSGDDPENIIYTEDITGQLEEGWNEITLSSNVQFDNTQNLWVSMYVERPGGETYNEPIATATQILLDRYDYYSYDGEPWKTMHSVYSVDHFAWMLRAFVSDVPMGKAVAIGEYDFDASKYKDYTKFSVEPSENDFHFPTSVANNSKDLMGYNVYRQDCAGNEEMVFMGYTLDDQFTDNTWGTTAWGTYKWVVEAVYTNNVSLPAYSNCLDKDMETLVNVAVSTNSGDAPENCSVVFTNISEPDLDLTYDLSLNETGLASIEDFRKGIYNIDVVLNGYSEIHEIEILIDTEKSFSWILEEVLLIPSELYVTPLGMATWGSGIPPVIPQEIDIEDFETGDFSKFDWQFNDAPWTIVEDAYEGNFAARSMEVEPDHSSIMEIDIILEEEAEFSFYYKVSSEPNWDILWFQINGEEEGQWSGSINWTQFSKTLPAGEYNIRFEYYKDLAISMGDDCAWVDSIVFNGESIDKYSDKGFQFYKVWHHGTFATDCDSNYYQYGENETLVSGETYLAEVAALYSMGLSEKVAYEWTYLPCEEFPGWMTLDAYHVEESDDIFVNWTDAGPSFDPLWIQYDDGVNVDAIGGPTEFSVAAKWDVDQLIDFNGTAITKIKFFPREAGSNFSLKVWQGADAANLVYEQTLSGLTFDEWNEIILDTPVNIDNTQELWVGYYVTTSGYPAGCGDFTGNSNSDLITLDGSVWEHLGDYGLNYSWNLGAYVEGAGKSMALPALTNNDSYNSSNATLAVGNLKPVSQENSQVKEEGETIVVGTNVYRNGEFLAYVALPDTFYLDSDLDPGYYDYCVAKVYTSDDTLHTWTSCINSNCLEVLMPENCIAPTSLTAEDLTGDGFTATLNWEFYMGGDGEFFEDFESGYMPTGWVTYDVDNDGYNWTNSSEIGMVNAHSGEYVMISASWVDVPLTPNNWAVTPPIEISSESELSWWVVAQDDLWSDEFYRVWISTTGNAVEDFNTVLYEGLSTANYQEIVVDLSSYSGEEVYIAFQHTDVSDMFMINIDDVKVTNTLTKAAFTPSVEPTATPMIPFKTTNMSSNEINSKMANYKQNHNNNRSRTGSNIYRDGEMIAYVEAPATTYFDELEEAGEHCYTVTGVYSICGETTESNEACIDLGVGVNQLENKVIAYPNPAKDYIKIEANSPINSIIVTNYMGQVITTKTDIESVKYTINTSNLSTGVYAIEIETAVGIKNLRIIISK